MYNEKCMEHTMLPENNCPMLKEGLCELSLTDITTFDIVKKSEEKYQQLQTKLEAVTEVIDKIYDTTVEGYAIELIDVLRSDTVWGDDGTADYPEKSGE